MKDSLNGIWYSIRWLLFFYIIYILLPYYIINKEKFLKNSLITFVLASLVVALMGVMSLPGQDWSSSFIRIQPIGINGIFPIGDNQNLIAEVLVVGIFFTLALKYWITATWQSKLLNLTNG